MTIWYLIRSLGFVALLALTLSTVLGALSIGGAATPVGIDRRLLRQLTHRSFGVLGLVALALHIVLAVVDKYVAVPLTAAVLPFGSGYRPVAMAVGVLGLYALIATTVSGALRGSTAASDAAVRGWRVVHASAYLGWVLSMAHGLFSGSDTATWWGIATYLGCGVGVVVALIVRLRVRPRRVPDVRGHLRLDPGALR
jgi:sulfoxide reductase heme-binding subunit YedZ